MRRGGALNTPWQPVTETGRDKWTQGGRCSRNAAPPFFAMDKKPPNADFKLGGGPIPFPESLLQHGPTGSFNLAICPTIGDYVDATAAAMRRRWSEDEEREVAREIGRKYARLIVHESEQRRIRWQNWLFTLLRGRPEPGNVYEPAPPS